VKTSARLPPQAAGKKDFGVWLIGCADQPHPKRAGAGSQTPFCQDTFGKACCNYETEPSNQLLTYQYSNGLEIHKIVVERL
jgi:hypothetical protein